MARCYFCLLDDGSIEYKGFTGTPEAIAHLQETVGDRVVEVDQVIHDIASPGDKFDRETGELTRAALPEQPGKGN